MFSGDPNDENAFLSIYSELYEVKRQFFAMAEPFLKVLP